MHRGRSPLAAVLAGAAAPVRIEQDAGADAGRVTPGADRGDDARHVAAGDVRQRRGLAGHALAREDVEEVERARVHLDEDLAGPGLGPRPRRLEGEDLGPAVAVHHHRAHRLPLLAHRMSSVRRRVRIGTCRSRLAADGRVGGLEIVTRLR